METKSVPCSPDTVTRANRTRISQLLAVAHTDPTTVEADLFHEFSLSVEEAVRLIGRCRATRRTKRPARTGDRAPLPRF